MHNSNPSRKCSVLKLGTRRSLLAKAQSGWVAREIERLNPGIQVELVGIDTRGDKILDVPLQSVQGKEFFVAELDDALRSGAVDLTVHSMKDLSLDRPRDFVCAAVPKRENPRDVVIFNTDVIEKLSSGQAIRIGTSSPRRLENLPAFLERALPFDARLEFVEIRGNVNTRLGRVHEPGDSPRRLDGVVLAFAGLIRLWRDKEARPEIARLLTGVRWMILPLRQCPTAPAQGALAVECRTADYEICEILKQIHHEPSAREAEKERSLLAEWGGGCHQKFGATSIFTRELGELFFVRGVKPDGDFIEDFQWAAQKLTQTAREIRAWNGAEHRGHYSRLSVPVPDLAGGAVFVAHSRAVPEDDTKWARALASARIWTSGVSSWFRLAKQGVWVEGCSEGLGFEELSPVLKESVLQLPPLSKWKIITHESAALEWKDSEVISTYRVEATDGRDADTKNGLQTATHFYWSSGSQFERLKAWVPGEANHACGPGKTAQFLRRHGLNPTVFPTAEEWKKWLSR